ncbi:MAG: hypothetical protein OEY51_07785 [Cyclobacteriaceae bacterium]|nr:hypothetical protein [Cyclobacteriaceae bacterium]
MRTRNYFTLLLLLTSIASLFFTGCSKKDPEPTRTELLTSATWAFSGVTVTGTAMDGLYTTAYSNAYAGSELSFNTNNTTSWIVLTIPLAGEWIWSADETVIQYTQSGITQEWTVIELTSTTLKISFTDSTINGTTTYTFTH